MKNKIFVLVMLASVFFANSAWAENKHQPLPYVNIGGFGLVLFPNEEVPQAMALPGYVLVTGSVMVPLGKRFFFIGGAGIDFSPAAGNWGIYSFAILEYGLKDWLGLDLIMIGAYDNDPWLEAERGRPHTGYVGLGPGVSFILPNGMIIAISVPFQTNVEGLGWSASPGVTVGIPLPI